MLQVLARVTRAPWASEGRNMAQLLSQVPVLDPIQPKEAFKIQASLFEKSISAADATAQATRAQGLSYSGGKTDILTQALPAPAQATPAWECSCIF